MDPSYFGLQVEPLVPLFTVQRVISRLMFFPPPRLYTRRSPPPRTYQRAALLESIPLCAILSSSKGVFSNLPPLARAF